MKQGRRLRQALHNFGGCGTETDVDQSNADIYKAETLTLTISTAPLTFIHLDLLRMYTVPPPHPSH